MQLRGDTRASERPSAGRRRRGAVLLAAAVLVGTAATVGVTAPAAQAADTTATLTLTGITSNTYPTGGNTVWVSPGSALTITQAPINVGANQGLLGAVSGLLGGVVNALNPVVGLTATVDLASVGKGTVTLAGGQSVATPGLAKGVYPIAWSFTAVTALGQNVALNGNQLNPLGVKVNAKNQYIGYIVSDTQSPCGGAQCISLQTPTLSVAPSLPVVGQLPTITVPGQNVNVPVTIPSIPGVNTPVTGATSPTTGTTAPTTGTTGSTTTTNPFDYTAQGCTGPCAVVPRGGGSGGQVGGASDVTLGQLGDAAAGSGARSATTGSGNALAGGSDGQGADQLAVDRAFAANDGAQGAGAGLPTSLTIAAVVALVGATAFWFVRRRAQLR